MREIDPIMANWIRGKLVTLSTCWKIQKSDGLVLGFTDFDSDIEIKGVVFKSGSGITTGSIEDNLLDSKTNVNCILNSPNISSEDLLNGQYDEAEVEVFLVNHNDVKMGKITLFIGEITKVRVSGKVFIAELRGKFSVLDQYVGDFFSTRCRAKFCDENCTLSDRDYSRSGSVTSVLDEFSFLDESLGKDEVKDNYYSYGSIRFISGKNFGHTSNISLQFGSQIRMIKPTPSALNVGDMYVMLTGCDKTFNTCCTKFNNSINFQGEPHVQNLGRLNKT